MNLHAAVVAIGLALVCRTEAKEVRFGTPELASLFADDELKLKSIPTLDEDGKIITSAKLDLEHRVVRRQSCDPLSPEQNRREAAVRCDPDYIAAVTESGLLSCGVPLFFVADSSRCGTDRGTLCALYSTDASGSLTDSAEDIERLCFEDSSLAETLQNCSAQCRGALEALAVNFGCCVRSETSITRSELAKTLTPLLWSQCGVTRPGPCEDAPSLPTDLNPSDPSCSFACIFSQSTALECWHIGSKLLQVYEDCGDENSANELRQRCGFNHKNRSCGASLDTLSIGNDPIFSIYDKCYRFLSTGQCPTECRDALEELRDTYGCCVNNFNTTSENRQEEIGPVVTSYGLWSACGVESPGFCSLPTSISAYDDLPLCVECGD